MLFTLVDGILDHIVPEGDFISFIVAIFLNKQLTVVCLKFRVLDFRRKRLIGVGSTLTFVEND